MRNFCVQFLSGQHLFGQRLFAHQRWWALICGVGLAAFLIAACVSWIAPFVPRIHDEYSYLLAADTLLHGRLANPPPEVWQPFQSFHTTVAPTYASKYPLGQGLFVALGWGMFGLPIAGCWLAAALCAASMTWMLAGVTGRRWAVVGGLLVACHPVLQSSWSQTLFSGWITAAGSALLAGGVFRLRRRYRVSSAAACGVGIALLALTRPYEGLVATCLSAGVLWYLWHQRKPAAKLFMIAQAAPVAALPIAVALCLIGLQNRAISGNWWSLAYQLHEQQYSLSPVFIFGHQRTPTLEASGDVPQIISGFQRGWALDPFLKRQGMWGWLDGVGLACWRIWDSWMLFALVPILSSYYLSRFRLSRLLALAVAIQVMFSAAVCWIYPHYLSPLLPWLVVLSVLGLRRIFRLLVYKRFLRVVRTQQLVGAILLFQLLLLLINVVRPQLNTTPDWAEKRLAIAAELEARAGEHLVLVYYSPQHNAHDEWVYNLADLEQAKVLWARGEREDWNARLRSHYAGSRFIWQLNPDEEDPQPKLLSSPSP